ncbi:MAG: DUF1549 and DUF1553 domain-containing protein [Planctomycetes bacterium]|nr:DUF1549 and DUF1553 domain-containing protein [Planctomycetota bacterium]
MRRLLSILTLTLLACSSLRAAEEPVLFRTDVIAALSRAGCNSGSCHGSPQGKNGFRLSLRGSDADLDYSTLVRELGGRRINRLVPDDSLILLKGSGRMKHMGGALIGKEHPSYRTIVRWINEGCEDSPPAGLVRLEVTPGTHHMPADKPDLQLAVKAHFKDGTSRDVTPMAVFTSSEINFAPVTPEGFVRFSRTGEASILVRFLDQITSIRLTYVQNDPAFKFQGHAPANYIDEHVFAKQKELLLSPAPLAADEVFLRRVYLDTIGTMPTAEEARAFLDSKAPDKRAKLIDQLLERDEYAIFWALKWADILRGSTTTISDRGVHSFHRYLVRTLADDKPMTDFAKDLLTGLGNTINKPAANFYRIARTPEDAAEATAQIFMGLRVQCAKCHNHPFEAITQTDYYGMAAYFARVQYKGAQFGLDDEIVYLTPNREIQNPKTRKPQEPIAFGTPTGPLAPDDDRRIRFAEWLTKPGNKYFAPSIVNRTWFHLLGKGIVDPVDDFRDTNPPSNPQLLQAMTDDFVKNGYRLKPLVRNILNSKTYQLASSGEPALSPQAAIPDRYFTKASTRMLSAEQILDAVSLATGVPEPYKGFPLGTRAIDLPEGGINHPFLQAFSKPVRDATCECAREDDPSLPQTLHLLNNAGLVEKVKSPKGRVAAWIKEGKDDAYLVEQVFLATLSRRPTATEKDVVTKHLKTLPDRAAGLHDLQYALINLNEFLLRH